MTTDATVTAKALLGVLGRFTAFHNKRMDAPENWHDALRKDDLYLALQRRLDGERTNGFENQLSTFMGPKIYQALRPDNIRATAQRVRTALANEVSTGAGMDGETTFFAGVLHSVRQGKLD